jgi:hypothetical protein
MSTVDSPESHESLSVLSLCFSTLSISSLIDLSNSRVKEGGTKKNREGGRRIEERIRRKEMGVRV